MSDQNLAFNQFVPLLVCVCASGASYWIYRNTMECIGDTLSKHQLISKSKPAFCLLRAKKIRLKKKKIGWCNVQ